MGCLHCPHRQPSNSWRPYGITVSIRLTNLTGFKVISASFTFSSHDLSKSSSASCWIFCYRVLVLGLLLFESSDYLYLYLLVHLWYKSFFFALSSHRRHFVCSFLMTHLTDIIDTMHLFGAELLSVTCFEVVASGSTGDWSSEGQEGYSGWVLQSVLGVWFRIARSGW